MKNIVFATMILTAGAWAKPIVFPDFGAIWVCKGDYWVAADRNARSVQLSNDKRGVNVRLYYNKKSGEYRSKNGRHTLYYNGKNLEANDVHFRIDGRDYSCYYEYMEQG
jgi:hypothetical protein